MDKVQCDGAIFTNDYKQKETQAWIVTGKLILQNVLLIHHADP